MARLEHPAQAPLSQHALPAVGRGGEGREKTSPKVGFSGLTCSLRSTPRALEASPCFVSLFHREVCAFFFLQRVRTACCWRSQWESPK